MPNWNMYYLIHVLWKLNTKNIFYSICTIPSLRWRHNGRDIVSNHQPHGCLLNRLFRRRSKKTSKLRVTGLCSGNSPGTGEFPAQMVSNAENVFIWWRHHVQYQSGQYQTIYRWIAILGLCHQFMFVLGLYLPKQCRAVHCHRVNQLIVPSPVKIAWMM